MHTKDRKNMGGNRKSFGETEIDGGEVEEEKTSFIDYFITLSLSNYITLCGRMSECLMNWKKMTVI